MSGNRSDLTLNETGKPWKEKVVIVNKYISNVTQNNNITLDDFFNGDKINFIKADIEGMEPQLLKGARMALSTSNNLTMVLCTYHNDNDAHELNQILTANGFYTEYSKGYMINMYNAFSPPYLRRGIIRAIKRGD
jgi:hypothetical protein